METVYFCSSISGLEVVGSKSQQTEIKELTYCTSKLTSVLNFISKNNDFIFSVGKDIVTNQWFICERVVSGLFSTLKGAELSVYQLKKPLLDSVEVCWTDKFASNEPSEVIEEERIADLYDFLADCNKKGTLTVCLYPDRINTIPEDDQDLVELATLRYRMYGDSILAKIRQYHPHLTDRVLKGIESEAFREYGI
jgi:hypothetical protein